MDLRMHFPNWHEALTRLLAHLARPPFNEWTAESPPGTTWELANWDDPRHQKGTVLPMDSHTGYLERTVAIYWDRGIAHFTQYDSKTGAGDETYDLLIPADWLKPMKKLPWPITGVTPLF